MCGENEKCVEKAISALQDLIKKDQRSYTSVDECIKDFDGKECQELNKLQKDLNITVHFDHQKPLIEVSGITRDVEQARNTIEEMIKTVRLAKEQESRADYVSNFVEWQYNDNNTFYNFDKITNLQLEDARKKEGKLVVKINKQSYTVDLKTFIATDAKGHSLSVQRLMKPEGKSNSHACYPLFYTYFGLNTVLYIHQNCIQVYKIHVTLWNKIGNLVSELKELTLWLGKYSMGAPNIPRMTHLSGNNSQTFDFYSLQDSQSQFFWEAVAALVGRGKAMGFKESGPRFFQPGQRAGTFCICDYTQRGPGACRIFSQKSLPPLL